MSELASESSTQGLARSADRAQRGKALNAFEQLRRRHMADAAALAPEMIARIGWSADRLAAHRQDRLRALVTSAVARSPWHAERLAGLDVERLDETSLDELPAMTKDDLMDRFDEIVTDERLTLASVNDHLARLPQAGYLLGRYTAVASGGSTGRRGRVRLRLVRMDVVVRWACAATCCAPPPGRRGRPVRWSWPASPRATRHTRPRLGPAPLRAFPSTWSRYP